MVNQNLEAHLIKAHQKIQNENYDEESRKLMTEALSKIRGLKVKAGQKEGMMAEVD